MWMWMWMCVYACELVCVSVHMLRAHTACTYTYCVHILRVHTACSYCVRILRAHTSCTYCVHILRAQTAPLEPYPESRPLASDDKKRREASAIASQGSEPDASETTGLCTQYVHAVCVRSMCTQRIRFQ